MINGIKGILEDKFTVRLHYLIYVWYCSSKKNERMYGAITFSFKRERRDSVLDRPTTSRK